MKLVNTTATLPLIEVLNLRSMEKLVDRQECKVRPAGCKTLH